jgi:hypothetical protein
VDPRTLRYAEFVMRARAVALGLVLALGIPGAAWSQITSIPPAPPMTSIPMPGRGPDVIDQVRQRALRPVPQAPSSLPVVAERWVPEYRYFSSTYQREIVIPGHYETVVGPQQSVAPPLLGTGPQGHNPVLFPGGERRINAPQFGPLERARCSTPSA